MHTRAISVLAILCGGAFALAGCNANLPAAPATSSDVGTAHFMPVRGVVRPASTGGYEGGPVLVKPKAYLILWNYKKYHDPDGVAKLLERYYSVIGGSKHNAIYTQYYEIVNGKKIYVQNPKDQFGGVWDDEQDAIPKNPTDAQVADEALRGVKKLGYDPNGSYIVATAHDHNSAGFGTQWCAQHNATYDGGKLVSYTNLPYIPDAGNNCGANFLSPPKDESGTDEGVTIIAGTMYGDSVTDPNPGTGWSEYGEIGDICAWTDIQNDQFRTKLYATQPMFSIASQSCVQYYYGK